ncbi:hypothetical protein EDEG_03987 [Edhazardia aedis USNM 41457]|uniref:Uncharacterized protein n=1 Tax=Edhazardia aedis (strain USNM 41457) TaxID=1003232 RepID=J9D0F9_EDHAE|nr:hypothetical protein EDEG_03987 [Edhazardia aedis USNM 41457]|eukprot:EJW01381.1 hypothetical protein EDEG_03987 [Edhazardia aedis USNM 41457]
MKLFLKNYNQIFGAIFSIFNSNNALNLMKDKLFGAQKILISKLRMVDKSFWILIRDLNDFLSEYVELSVTKRAVNQQKCKISYKFSRLSDNKKTLKIRNFSICS